MRRIGRKLLPLMAAILGATAIVWALKFESLPPADFTFSNGTEIKSVDPAIVTGAPEGRIIRGLYEGLLDWHPKTLEVVPGVAESWEVSDDGLTYTFHLREKARWSDGQPVTAEDFHWSFRRFLDPMLGAEYAFLLYHVENAEKYNKAEVEPRDRVEVELTERSQGALPFARNEVLKGELLEVEEIAGEEEDDAPLRVYTVEIDGARRRFCADPAKAPGPKCEPCTQVLLDFDSVALKVVDERTLRMKLAAPTPYFLKLMGFYPLFPVNQRCLETHGYPAWTDVKNIVTNGPFVMSMRRVRDRIRMTKNPLYWDKEHVHLNIIDALAIESLTTDLNMYETGKLDWITSVPPTIIPVLLEQNRPDFQPEAYLAIYYYKVNTDEPALSDVRVRRALGLAIDKQQVVDKVTRAGQIPAYRIVPPGIVDYDAAKLRAGVTAPVIDYERQVAQARRLMEEAGYPGGRGFPKIELLYNTNDLHGQIGELLQSQWKEVLGINVELVNKEWGSYLSDQRNQKYFLARAAWIGDYADPNTFLDLFITGRAQNNTGWGNERYDELIEQRTRLVQLTDEERAQVEKEVRAQDDWTEELHDERLQQAENLAVRLKRMDFFLEAENILLEEAAVIPLYYYVTQAMVRPYVKGFYNNIQNVHPYRGVRIDQKLKRKILQGGSYDGKVRDGEGE